MATLTTLVQTISMAYRRVWSQGSTTSTGAANTAPCTSLIAANIPTGSRIQIASADREITAFNRSTGLVTFAPPSGSPIPANTPFTITPRPWNEIIAAITRALTTITETWQTTRTTDSLTPLNGRDHTYDLPSDCHHVTALWVFPRPFGGNPSPAILPGETPQAWPHYTLLNVDGARKLQLTQQIAGHARLSYTALITIPTDSNIGIDFGTSDDRSALAYVIERSLAELITQDITANPTAQPVRALQRIADKHYAEAERIRATAPPPQHPTRVTARALPRIH